MKIIFLDIDGPMIPSYCFLETINASYDRNFSKVCINVLNYILSKFNSTEIKIVCNSMHNYHNRDEMEEFNLRNDLISAGIPAIFFHEDWRTRFGIGIGRGAHSRDNAIRFWLEDHLEITNYVCFDDELFTDKNYLIHIDYDDGLNLKHAKKALTILENVDMFI